MTDLLLDRVHAVDGISVPNFFNGRILSAEDLRLLLDGDRAHRRLLGRAIGQGVAGGLRVKRSGPRAVIVTAGLAINGHGETIDLPLDVTLDLGTTGTTGSTAGQTLSAGVFLDCDGPPTGSSDAEHAFVLTIRPDSTVVGSAPADVGAAGASCGPGYVREGVRFRRIAFDPIALWSRHGPGGAPPSFARRQNVLAHLLLGSWAWRSYGADPFDRTPLIGEALADVGVEPCEVPVATYFMSGGSVQHLDMWGVRRHAHRPFDGAPGAELDVEVADAHRAIGEATFQQFQAQLAELVTGTTPITAAARFPFLPAAGLLPVGVLGNTLNPASFAVQGSVPFFAGVTHRPLDTAVSVDRVEEILRRGTEMPAIYAPEGSGLPVHVALVVKAPDTDPYAIFFGGDHPGADRVRIGDLIDRVDDLEDRLAATTTTGPSVTVVYKPGKGRVPGGVIWSQWLLGQDPELEIGESGMLRFNVIVSDAGDYELDVRTDARTFRLAAVQAALVDADVESVPTPLTTRLNAGTTAFTVLVSATRRPLTQGLKLRGPAGRLDDVGVTFAVASATDASVKDSATVLVGVTG